MNSSTQGSKYSREKLRSMAREVLADNTARKTMLVVTMCAKTGLPPEEVVEQIKGLASEEVDEYA